MRAPESGPGKFVAPESGRDWDWWKSAVLGAIWLPLLAKLAPAWSASVEQAHGWAVPVLAAYLWAERARTVNAMDAGARARGIFGGAGGRAGAALSGWALVGGLVALAGGLTVLEANPLWPAAQWAAYAAAAAVTLAWLAREGGGAVVRRFLFPLFFLSTALTWPTAVTERLTAALVGLNTQLAATVVSAAGFPAVVSGNVIEVASGFVGVDEACSGVRSLQAAWMAGWFFGELGRLARPRRWGLVGGAMAMAVAGNMIRTTALTWLAAADGAAASARWHDAVGTAELGLTLAGVVGLAWLFGRGSGVNAAGDGGADRATIPACRPAAAWTFGVLAGALLAGALPTAWYRWHEVGAGVDRVQWELRQPVAGWRSIELPAVTQRLLRASASGGLERNDPATGARTLALLVRWDGDVTTAVFAEQHGPMVCLPSAGIGVETSAAPVRVTVDGVPIDFSVGRFAAEGREQFVLYCQWDAWLGRARAARRTALTDVVGWRLARVRAGQRRGDAAYLVFVVPAATEDAARAWLAEWAPRLLARR